MTTTDPTLRTDMDDTAEFEVTYAGPWRRVWATLIDVVVLVWASALVGAAGGGAPIWAIYVLGIITWEVGFTSIGGTPGKRILGVRVTALDGRDPGLPAGFARALVRPLSALPLGFGFWWMLDQPRRQAWHDVAAGTLVVHETRVQHRPSFAPTRH